MRTIGRAVPALGLANLAAAFARGVQIDGAYAASMPTHLINAAQAEGTLNVALVPNNFANYAEIIERFTKKFGIKVNNIDTKGDAAVALDALLNSNDSQIDVVDIPLAQGEQAKQQGLLQPFRPNNWNKIPRNLKDARGFWAGSHFGVLVFEVNEDVVKNVPTDWADLLKPEYKGLFALAGDPRQDTMTMSGVFAAALANGGSVNNAMPGLDFFAQLNKAGTLGGKLFSPATFNSGQTPMTLVWDYHALRRRDLNRGKLKVKVVVPKRGVLAKTFVQGIAAKAPHLSAAKLWLNHLYSDEGQTLLLKGYARSTWFGDLLRRKALPSTLLELLPSASAYANTIFPTVKQLAAAQKAIVEGWDKVVGVAF